MIVMITTDFYADYELYRTEDPEDIKANMIDFIEGTKEPDKSKHELIGSQDDFWTDEAIEMADEVIFIGDYEQED